MYFGDKDFFLLVFFIWLLKFYISKALLATHSVRENRAVY